MLPKVHWTERMQEIEHVIDQIGDKQNMGQSTVGAANLLELVLYFDKNLIDLAHPFISH